MGRTDRELERDGGLERVRPAEVTVRDSGPHTAIETRTLSEQYADLRQSLESGWDRNRRFEAPRGELAAFQPRLAGLPEVTLVEAGRYIERYRAERPWLVMAEHASPEAARIIVAADLGGGHGHIRHEGWVTEEASMRRAAYLEDPAQLDLGNRRAGIDGLDANGLVHRCRTCSTRFTDPDAFATALVRGAGHARVREALGQPFDPDHKPREVRIPISELLGPDGYRHCTGWRLEAQGGSMKKAREDRDSWVSAQAGGRPARVREPQAKPVATFEGGSVIFAFRHDHARGRYEIVTMFPRPRESDLG